MSESLTMTLIPEDKFRRFSRYPQVKATQLDERYNNIYTKPIKQKHQNKLNIRFLQTPSPIRSREVTFDFRTKPEIASDLFETVPRHRPSPQEKIVVHKIDFIEPITDEELIIEGRKLKKIESKFGKLKEKYLADSREKERNCIHAQSKQEVLNNTKHAKSDWHLISYELPKAPRSFYEKEYYSIPGKKFLVDNPSNTVDDVKKEETLNDTREKKELNSKNRKTSSIYGDHALLELIDFGRPVPTSEEKMLITMKNPTWSVKNTRFGGDTKVTAYRPSTSMDRFRTDHLEVIKESPLDGIDLDEGRRIWEEVNTIINNSTSKRKRMNQWLNNESYTNPGKFISVLSENTNPAIDRADDLKYAIELRPRFDSGNEGEIDKTKDTLWSDETKMMNDIAKGSRRFNIGNDFNVEKRPASLSFSTDTRHRRFKRDNFFVEDNNDKLDMKLILEEYGIPEIGLNGNELGTDSVGHKMMDCSNDVKDSETGTMELIYPSSGHYAGPVIHLPSEGVCKGKGVAMTTTTTLPRITPLSTPLPTGITQAPPRSHSSASMYVPYPPRELSNSFDYLRIPGRINPLAPPPPRRRINWTWETTDQHHENEKRRLLMQKREHTRYHSAWSKAYYGAPAEKEAYRRHFREVLKQQMADKNVMEKNAFREKIKETEQAITFDKDCRMNDSKEHYRKHAYLMQYRDVNKQQMEDRWASTRYSRELENRIDRERLRYNPINWSCSLK